MTRLHRSRLLSPLRVAAALAALVAAAPAQAGQDPMREIQELARRIDEEMQEIDKLLLESSKPDPARSGSPVENLRKTRDRSEAVEQNIDELIEKLQQMKNRGGGGGGQQQDQQDQQGQQDGQQQGQQQGGQQGRQQNRRDGETPDYVDQSQQQGQQQGQQQQGQQQGQQNQPQDGQQPQGGEANALGGENRPTNMRPDNETGPGQPGTGEGDWGQLQPYLNDLKNRGSSPKMPERYRKYWEAYLEAQKKGGGN